MLASSRTSLASSENTGAKPVMAALGSMLAVVRAFWASEERMGSRLATLATAALESALVWDTPGKSLVLCKLSGAGGDGS